MSKDIDKCYKCMEDYCMSCVMYGNCDQCGENTCGEVPCMNECQVKGGCESRFCKDCLVDHNCPEDEE